MKKIPGILFCLLLFTIEVYAYFDIDIRILTMQNGLADNTISCIHKDRDGFMWFGTHNGLSRYDGKIIRNFGLADKFLSVSQIRETTNDLLWLITSDNLMCFDRKTEKLLPVETTGWLTDILFMDDYNAWALSGHVLVCYQVELVRDKEANITTVKLHEIKRRNEINRPDASLRAICRSDEGVLFLLNSAGEVFTFDIKKEEVINIRQVIDKPNLRIQHILYSGGLLWISTIEFGVFVYDPLTGHSRQYTYKLEPTPTSTSHHDSHHIIALPGGRFLSATWNGYTVFNPEGDDTVDFTTEIYNNTTSRTLRNMETRMLCAYHDPAGMLWVGTRGGGVYASDLRLQFYARYHQDMHNEICGIAVDAEGYLWFAGYHSGMMRSLEPFNQQTKVDFEPVAPQGGKTVIAVVSDADNNLWFGGRNTMLTCYRADTRSYVSYPILPEGEDSWSGDVWNIYLGDPGKIWLGTTNGLLVFDRQTKKFDLISDTTFGTIRAIAAAGKDFVWLGTSSGLMKFSLTERIVTKKAYEGEKGLDAREVRSLLASRDNHLYVGYSSGFAVFNFQTDETEFYTIRDGLCNNFIGCLTEDATGDIWLGTNSGITRFSRSQQLFYNYYISGSNRSVLLYDDYLFWGNNLNLTYFHPESVKSLHATPAR